LLTDGRPDDLSLTTQKARELETNKIDIIGIGIGSDISFDNLRDISTVNLAFTVASIEQFSSIVTGIKVSPGSPPTFESNPVVYARKVRFDISFSDMDDQKFICFIVYQLYDVDTWKERVRNRINEILIVGLEPDTVYFFKVSALIDDIETSCSKVVKIITAKEKIETIKLNDKREVDEETNFIKEYIKKFDPSLKNTKKKMIELIS